MNRIFLLRLALDLVAALLLLFCLSYWWLGNVMHELAGTALFVLLIGHNVFNRRWFAGAAGRRLHPGGLFHLTATFLLLVSMLVLLVTSVLISNALSAVMSVYGGFTVRQVHILAAYWAVMLASIHLGLRWPMLMVAARFLCGISRPNALRTLALRTIALIVGIYGVWSSSFLALGSKLSMQMTLDWWNFEESVAGSFVHWVAIAGLYISLTHYSSHGLRNLRRSRPSATTVTQDVQ